MPVWVLYGFLSAMYGLDLISQILFQSLASGWMPECPQGSVMGIAVSFSASVVFLYYGGSLVLWQRFYDLLHDVVEVV